MHVLLLVIYFIFFFQWLSPFTWEAEKVLYDLGEKLHTSLLNGKSWDNQV